MRLIFLKSRRLVSVIHMHLFVTNIFREHDPSSLLQALSPFRHPTILDMVLLGKVLKVLRMPVADAPPI